MVHGALWCGGGLLVTAITYGAAVGSPGGGHYIIAWGAIVFGAVQFFRGYARRSGTPVCRSDLQLLLNTAARLETVDRAKAVAMYEEIVRSFPGTRASAEAHRNLQVLNGQRH